MDYRKYLRCIFCCDFCLDYNGVKAEIIGHLVLLITMTVSFIVVLHPDLDPLLSKLECCRNETGGILQDCQKTPGAIVALRFSFVYVLFFLISFISELTTKRFEDGIRYFARSFWLLKLIFIILGCFATTYIPPKTYDKIWTVFLFIGSVIFIVAEVYTIIRLSYVIIIILHKLAERGSNSAYKIQVTLFALGIVLSVVGEGMLIYYYPLCSFNLGFLIINSLIPIIVCFWSVSSCVKAKNGYSGFLQGSILTCFVVFYTWSAFTSDPYLECNPYFDSPNPYLSLDHIIEIVLIFAIYIINTNFTYILYIDELEDSKQDDTSDISRKQTSGDGHYKVQVYYSLMCSFLRGPMICIIVMTALNWSPPSAGSDVHKTSRHAMWFKLVGCWISIIFFIITLYTPSVYGLATKKRLLNKK